MMRQCDTVIVGTGVAGLYAALNLPRSQQIIMLTKAKTEESDSFLAQGGICVLQDPLDYDSYFEDTMRAGHYENRVESVDIMIRSSWDVIMDLVDVGVEFEKKDGHFVFTREGAHSRPRILFHADETGKEITSKLLTRVRTLPNVQILEHTTMTDLVVRQNRCRGIRAVRGGKSFSIAADNTILATGGIGGLYEHSTNYPHLTGDALRLAKKYNIRLDHLDYVQIHPTVMYSQKPGRRFLLSESLRGEGALLYNNSGERFVDELKPRDEVTKAIQKEMEREGSKHVWLSLKEIDSDVLHHHFPNICARCEEEGYDVDTQWIPSVPAQHYFMGGIWVDSDSHTDMDGLYAVGETSCNGVHGANRLASNSLLESLVFARRAAARITGELMEESAAAL
jgi:L-aspartate oxidase